MINNISFSDDHFNRLSKFLNRLNQGELSQPEAKEFFHDMFGVEIHFESDNESKLRILKLIREVGLSEKEKRTDKKERIFAWEKGWNEIADSLNVLSRNIKIDDLIPQYVYNTKCLRFNKSFITTENSGLLEVYFNFLVLQYYFENYLKSCSRIIELGCGTAKNILQLKKKYNNTFYGSDWAYSSVKIIEAINIKSNLSNPIIPIKFDMLTMDGLLNLPSLNGFGVFTNHSFEQLSSNWRPVLNYLIKERPSIVVHIEPIEEYYCLNEIFDISAVMFHRKRKYLTGFLSHLKKLQSEKIIKIHEEKRLYFGCEQHEAYNILVWSPI